MTSARVCCVGGDKATDAPFGSVVRGNLNPPFERLRKARQLYVIFFSFARVNICGSIDPSTGHASDLDSRPYRSVVQPYVHIAAI